MQINEKFGFELSDGYQKINKENEIKNIAKYILSEKLNLDFSCVKRFTTGYCHSVFYVKTSDDKKYVMRLTSSENKEYYQGSLCWLKELEKLNILVPKILYHGEFDNLFYTLISFIDGKDLGEVYESLTGEHKRDIAKEIANIQCKVSNLPQADNYGSSFTKNDAKYKSWQEFLKSIIERARDRIAKNKIFDVSIYDELISYINIFEDYFKTVAPTAFLDDITTKNVLINNGKLSGIIDVDEICYGDSLLTIGLTNMALIADKLDTNYIDYWLNEIKATGEQKKVLIFYTMLFCVDFMGEQGMIFENGKQIIVNEGKVKRLNSIYKFLKNKIRSE